MTPQQMRELTPGDTVRNKREGLGYIIMQNDGSAALVSRVRILTEPEKWELVLKANHQPFYDAG